MCAFIVPKIAAFSRACSRFLVGCTGLGFAATSVFAQGTTAPPPTAPPPVNTPAFVIQSDNGDNRLQVGGFLQAEGRFALNDDQQRVTDTFTMRRFRFIFQGRLARHFDYYWNVDFSNNVLTLRDAYFDNSGGKPSLVCKSLSRAKLMQKSQAMTSCSRKSGWMMTHLVSPMLVGIHQGE